MTDPTATKIALAGLPHNAGKQMKEEDGARRKPCR
jgi:hypothetical protein